MARPKKNTVDYFPHDCHWSKEIEIFVNKYGNNGYAFYYRLLELIGLTPLHLYDCNELRDWQYLLAKTSVEEDMAVELIEFLVALSIIDKEMWEKKKIWIQSLVDSVRDVYKNRTTSMPTKDGSLVENFAEEEFSAEKQSLSVENRGFPARNSQSKGKETKLNKKILNKRTGFLAECVKCDFDFPVESSDIRMVCRQNQEHGPMQVSRL